MTKLRFATERINEMFEKQIFHREETAQIVWKHQELGAPFASHQADPPHFRSLIRY
jgi:hypothetical protein